MESLDEIRLPGQRIHRFQVGDVRVTRIVELEGPGPGTFVLPHATPENVRSVDWLAPHFATEDGALLMSVHAFVIESMGRRIVVDTCVGNEKPRAVASWNDLHGPFLEDLIEAGFARDAIDTVLCTHLHVDHVGWNTMREGDRWVPTFPRARYLFARKEWEYWSTLQGEEAEVFGDVIGDSVQPVVDAGLADLVEPDHEVTEEVRLEPTPGHTPGHVSVRIRSGGAEAVITGDLMHHPIQMARPDWGSHFDYDGGAAETTRRRFLADNGDRSVRVFGTHFATPSVGLVVRDGAGWRFVV
ncbi:MAG TPA: MBL fold metallo-hydrolase [Myxococcota bacterium]|jgi:glyoxylase-like metal-dependent hydrolase (beta-lactamase superfamily II)|nr:MBL fold metallo-hydrolase [Myxococcota bacterium]